MNKPAPTVIEVTETLNGERLDRALAKLYPELSRTRAQSAIKAGVARVNGRAVRASHLLEVGQRIEVDAGALTAGVGTTEGEAQPQAEAIPLRVVYEDEHLLVVDKAAGLVVHPAPGHATGTLVNAYLHHVGGEADEDDADPQRPGIVHRLD